MSDSPFVTPGDRPAVTPIHGFALPPRLPGRAAAPVNGNSQYRLPDPLTGKLTSYPRASTVAKTLEDTYMLERWAQRQMLLGLATKPSLTAQLDALVLEHQSGQRTTDQMRHPLNTLADKCQRAAGSQYYAEFGTAVHAWTEQVDLGLRRLRDVPESFRPWVEAHRLTLAQAGLTVAPEYTERIVLNTQYGIAGTLDRLYWCADGLLRLGDIKTSRTMDYSWLYFAIQLAVYHGAGHMLSLDGTTWEPMPVLEPDVALVSHLPREDPADAAIVPISMEFGREALAAAMHVRSLRRRARQRQSTGYVLGWHTPEDQRRAEARLLLETSYTESDMAGVWEQFADVWNDELTSFGRSLLRLSSNANATHEETR